MDKLASLPLPENLLRADLWVSGIVYFPLDTVLLKATCRTGCTTSDSAHMALSQAVGAFKLVAGLDPDAARMHAHFRSLVGNEADCAGAPIAPPLYFGEDG